MLGAKSCLVLYKISKTGSTDDAICTMYNCTCTFYLFYKFHVLIKKCVILLSARLLAIQEVQHHKSFDVLVNINTHDVLRIDG